MLTLYFQGRADWNHNPSQTPTGRASGLLTETESPVSMVLERTCVELRRLHESEDEKKKLKFSSKLPFDLIHLI